MVKRLLVLGTVLVLAAMPLFGETVFLSSRQVNLDAQNIRLKALEMKWEVGIPASFVASTLITAKALIYPKADVEIRLRENDGSLWIRAQVRSRDAGTAGWHKIPARKLKL